MIKFLIIEAGEFKHVFEGEKIFMGIEEFYQKQAKSRAFQLANLPKIYQNKSQNIALQIRKIGVAPWGFSWSDSLYLKAQ